jgi:hypothetical protein
MYFDNRPCQVCGSQVRLRTHTTATTRAEPDATVDDRVCTNPDCATNAADRTAETPTP